MATFRIKRGLDLPINGAPKQVVRDEIPVKRLALLGPDYPGMKPRFHVEIGDSVKKGQLLFADKKREAIRFTAPGSGRVVEINRGQKRRFLSLVIELAGSDEITFKTYDLAALDRNTVKSQLLESGLWTALRARPFGHVADPDTVPHAIFVTAMDTHPLAPAMAPLLKGREDDFYNGLRVLSSLTDGKLYLCKDGETAMDAPDISNLEMAIFTGPHPAGNAGTHIHFLDPVNAGKTVWHIGLQDVMAVGCLFTTGRLDTRRVISLAGPGVKNPILIKTTLGASTEELVRNALVEGEKRVVSGSVLSGHAAEGPLAYLGRYHQQVSVIPESTERHLLGWLSLGFNLFSVKNIVASKLIPGRTFDFTSEMHGGQRSIVPVGSYEKVMPLDILPNYLLRALEAGDMDEAEKLGALELVEEDMALLTFVCPSKIDHGVNLRHVLDTLEKEGV